MKALRLLTLLAACCVTSTIWAAEPAPAKPASESAAPKTDEQTQVQPGTKTEEDDVDVAAEKAPPKPAASGKGKGGSPERFVPSEQVRADFDVSFPIDI